LQLYPIIFQERKAELDKRVQNEDAREAEEIKREQEFSKVIEMEKNQLMDERKKLEEEKAKFLEMTSKYGEQEQKRGYVNSDPADSGLGSRSDTAEVRLKINLDYFLIFNSTIYFL
jgi:hypothetical protein